MREDVYSESVRKEKEKVREDNLGMFWGDIGY